MANQLDSVTVIERYQKVQERLQRLFGIVDMDEFLHATDDILVEKFTKMQRNKPLDYTASDKLLEQRGLKINTLEIIHNVLHQIFQVAVDDNYIRQNPSDRILSELKRSNCYEEPHKRALTIQEQELFLNFLRKESNPLSSLVSCFCCHGRHRNARW